jgi:hypothetical protein
MILWTSGTSFNSQVNIGRLRQLVWRPCKKRRKIKRRKIKRRKIKRRKIDEK